MAGSPIVRVPVPDLDASSTTSFMSTIERLFERAPRFSARLVAARPFGSNAAFIDRARDIAHAMPEDEQVELVNAHPRLGAAPSTVSAASFVEQGFDKTPITTDVDVAAELERLNEAYEHRFGFRYCVFVAGRSRAELIPAFEAALDGDREAELDRAIDAVVDIAEDRLAKMTPA
jgi:2-oxo-4-hydroxy-4-carboxy-5-ureidoimidazoline decarboxylase